MHAQIITYRLNGMTEAEYLAGSPPDAEVIAKVPGLVSKVWLADAATNTYGGFYLWVDRAAMEAFMASGLVGAIMARPHLAEITSRDFAAPDALSRTTRGLVGAALA
jgi:hypothetical protein